VRVNESWSPTKEKSPRRDVDVDFDFFGSGIESNNPMFSYRMRIDINNNPAALRAADYQCTVVLRSYFSYTPDDSEHETYDRIVLPNGLAMTYSIARGIIASLTGNSRFGPLFLPTVNMHEVIRTKLMET